MSMGFQHFEDPSPAIIVEVKKLVANFFDLSIYNLPLLQLIPLLNSDLRIRQVNLLGVDNNGEFLDAIIICCLFYVITSCLQIFLVIGRQTQCYHETFIDPTKLTFFLISLYNPHSCYFNTINLFGSVLCSVASDSLLSPCFQSLFYICFCLFYLLQIISLSSGVFVVVESEHLLDFVTFVAEFAVQI